MIKALFIGCVLAPFAPLAIHGGSVPEKDRSASGKSFMTQNDRQFMVNYIRDNKTILSGIKEKDKSSFRFADAVLLRFGLPTQLKYLAVIESDLRSDAVSRVGATGAWQLMPETARLLGLQVSDVCDERKQFSKSTRAAARYLRDLYTEYGDWLLVLAAYNGGEGPVNHAIRKAGSRNFWQLQAYLPAESRDHVKKFIATLYYFEGPSRAAVFTGSTGPNGPGVSV